MQTAEFPTGRLPKLQEHCIVPGVLNTDLYFVQDTESELYVGCDPEYYPVSKRLFYSVEADGETIADGKFGAWILGRDHIDIDISGKSELRLHVRTEDGQVDHALVKETVRTIFWGDPYFVTSSGKKLYLADTSYKTDNIDNGNGIGVDYEGGPVKIQAKKFLKAVPGDVIDKSREGVITIDLSGLEAVRFVSDIGGDYPVGDESERRRFVALKKRGQNARFISVLEPYTDNKMIKNIKFESYDSIRVYLNDGREQQITVSELDGDGNNVSVLVNEYIDGTLIRSERAGEVK